MCAREPLECFQRITPAPPSLSSRIKLENEVGGVPGGISDVDRGVFGEGKEGSEVAVYISTCAGFKGESAIGGRGEAC